MRRQHSAVTSDQVKERDIEQTRTPGRDILPSFFRGVIVIQPDCGKVSSGAEVLPIGGSYETDARHSSRPLRLRYFS